MCRGRESWEYTVYVITEYIKKECVYVGVILWGNEDYMVMTLVWESIDFALSFWMINGIVLTILFVYLITEILSGMLKFYIFT